jgi:hypothetical protein
MVRYAMAVVRVSSYTGGGTQPRRIAMASTPKVFDPVP